MRESLKFVVVGHVDHGKSTLIGRLLYDTNSLPPDKMEEVRRLSEISQGQPEFAFVMDHLEEERRNRITIDTAQIFFRSYKRDYVIIDAPGHKQFLKNMITGSTQAEAALLLIDAEEGLREQTHRHAYMLSLLGIKQLLVVINKMDLVGYSQERFEELQQQITKRLAEFGLAPLRVIPICAQQGDNVATAGEKLSWYGQGTLLEGLDELANAPSAEHGPLRFPVQDVYDIDGQKVLVGRMASGTMRQGQGVTFHPLGKTARVGQIKRFEGNGAPAVAGESIGVVLQDGPVVRMLRRGEVACDEADSPAVGNTIAARVFWMSGEPLGMGETVELKCATQQVEATVTRISDRLNSSTLEPIVSDVEELRETEVAKVTFKTDNCICSDPFERVASMGRLVLMRQGDVVGGAVVH